MSGTDERMAEYRAGTMTAEDARTFEREILSDRGLAEELYGDVNLSAAIEEVASSAERRVVALPRWWQRRSVQVAVPLAAAAVALLVLLPPREPGPGKETFRGTDGSARLIEPAGDLADVPSRFVWTRDPGAAMYRLELYDSAAQLLFHSTTSDTTVLLPKGTLSGEEFREGYWKVMPMTEAGVERPGPPPTSIRVRAERR